MRSPNPLVAIGITTLVTVGAIHSGSAQASAPDSSPEPAAASLQPPQSDLSEISSTEQTSQAPSVLAAQGSFGTVSPGIAHPVVSLLPQIQTPAERVDSVMGLRNRSIAAGLLAFSQPSKIEDGKANPVVSLSRAERRNRANSDRVVHSGETNSNEATSNEATSASPLAQAPNAADSTAETSTSETQEPSLPPLTVPTEVTVPAEAPTAEASAADIPSTESAAETSTPASETTSETAPEITPTGETSETTAEPSGAAAESVSPNPPVPEAPAAEASAAETPAAETSTAQATEAPTSETPATETPATETPAAGTTETPASETPTPNQIPQPAPVEAPAENTLTAPPPETPAADTPATNSPSPSNTSTEALPATAASTPSRVDVPDYLNPSPNPLDFPTRPEEVEIQGTQPITLRQAVDLAIRNSPQLQQVRQQLAQAQAQLDQARAANNPTVSVSANLVQSGQESATQTQDPPFTVNAQGQVVPNTNARPPQTVIRSTDSAALNGSLEVNYALFTSGRRPALIRAAEGQVRTQQLEVERQTNELILQVANAYYDLQQAGAQVRIYQSNVTQAEQSLRDAEALERAGVGTRFDVLQAQVDVANAQQQLTQQLSSFDISRRNLAQVLNASNAVDLTAADPIAVAGDWNLSLQDSIVQALKNRAELEQQLVQREASEQQRRAALAQLGPQVNLQGSFGLNNNLDAGNGFLNNYQVGVGVSLNLYDGGSARAQARAQEAQIAQSESQFATFQDQIRFQTEQAYSQLQASATNIQTTALAVQQAAEALRLARLRFQAGVGTQTDVLRQQTVLAQSQVNNLQAILGYNRALATLQRQVSNLPEGFLSETP